MKMPGLVFVVLGLAGATIAVNFGEQDSLRQQIPTLTPTVTPTPTPVPISCDADECSSCCDSDCEVVACLASEGKKCGGSCPGQPNLSQQRLHFRKVTCNFDSDNVLECDLCECPQEWYDNGIPKVMNRALKNKFMEIATTGPCKLARSAAKVNVICAIPNDQQPKLFQCRTRRGGCIVNERDYFSVKMTVTKECFNTGGPVCQKNPITGVITCGWGTTVCDKVPQKAVVTFANKCGDTCQPVRSGDSCDRCYVSKTETRRRPPPKCIAPYRSTRRPC